jgi:predicted membrane channel-forming protein YqfA (hemolysin III family)
MKNKRKYYELALSFWIGAGLMSIINIWKITQSMNPLRYSWIMFGVSLLLVIICLFYLIRHKSIR